MIWLRLILHVRSEQALIERVRLDEQDASVIRVRILRLWKTVTKMRSLLEPHGVAWTCAWECDEQAYLILAHTVFEDGAVHPVGEHRLRLRWPLPRCEDGSGHAGEKHTRLLGWPLRVSP